MSWNCQKHWRMQEVKRCVWCCEAEIQQLQAALRQIIIESGKVDINNWPAQQQICQVIAQKALEGG